MDPRIGILVREGRTIFYAFHSGKYIERYSLTDMEHCLAVRDGRPA